MEIQKRLKLIDMLPRFFITLMFVFRITVINKVKIRTYFTDLHLREAYDKISSSII